MGGGLTARGEVEVVVMLMLAQPGDPLRKRFVSNASMIANKT